MPGNYRERNSTSDRTLDILTMFTDERPRLTASELAAELGTARSTAYRYLQALTSAGFVEEDPGGGGFRLGMRIFELAGVARRSYGFLDLAAPVLAELSAATGETSLLTRRHGTSVVCLDKCEAPGRLLRISYERGTVLAPNAGASALILFAWDDPVTLAALLAAADLPRYTPSTPVRPAHIVEILADAREQGYLVIQGVLDADAVGIAAPVRDAAGTVIAAVSVVALAGRTAGAQADALIDAVRSGADTLTSQIALTAN
jgi:DNA-binding IclR family transcriptional regulator